MSPNDPESETSSENSSPSNVVSGAKSDKSTSKTYFAPSPPSWDMPFVESIWPLLIAVFILPPTQSIPRTLRVPPTPSASARAAASEPPSILTRADSMNVEPLTADEMASVPLFIVVPTESRSALFHTPLVHPDTWRIVCVASAAPSITIWSVANFAGSTQSSMMTPLKAASEVLENTRVVDPVTSLAKLFLTMPEPSIPPTRITAEVDWLYVDWLFTYQMAVFWSLGLEGITPLRVILPMSADRKLSDALL